MAAVDVRGRAVGQVPAADRDPFLDAVRVIALVRVVLWHALGAAVLTYSWPLCEMFCYRILLAEVARRGSGRVIVTGAPNLVPLWVFALGAYTAIRSPSLSTARRRRRPWRDIPFLVCDRRPPRFEWECGYLSSPLVCSARLADRGAPYVVGSSAPSRPRDRCTGPAVFI